MSWLSTNTGPVVCGHSAEGALLEHRHLTARYQCLRLEPGVTPCKLPPWIRCLARSPSSCCCSLAGSIETSRRSLTISSRKSSLRLLNGSWRLRLTDDQRRPLAAKGKVLGRRQLAQIAGIVTLDTIPAVVTTACRPEIRRLESAMSRSPSHQVRHRGWWSAWRMRLQPGATRASARQGPERPEDLRIRPQDPREISARIGNS